MSAKKKKPTDLQSKFQDLTLDDGPQKTKKLLTVISSNMQTSNGSLYLNVKTMNELSLRSGDPVYVYTKENQAIRGIESYTNYIRK